MLHTCRYKSDIAIMQQLGLKHLRLSISWSRLLPKGKKGSPVNPEAAKFYSSILENLAEAGTIATGRQQHGMSVGLIRAVSGV